jgi:hypothetical protein
MLSPIKFNERKLNVIATTDGGRNMTRNYPKELISFVDTLIDYNAKWSKGEGYQLNVNELSIEDLSNFAAHFIKFKSTEEEGWDWLLDDGHREEMANQLGNYILEWRESKKADLLEKLISDFAKAAIHSFKDKMQEVVNERLGKVEHDEYTDRGYVLREQVNGEKYWSPV